MVLKMNREGNYGKQIIAAQEIFLRWDQAHMIERFSLEHSDETMFILFYDSKYSIDRKTAQVCRCEDQSPAGFNEVLSIYDMLCYAKEDACLAGEWRTLSTLDPHSNFGSAASSPYSNVERHFLGKVSQLRAACSALGGTAYSKADVGYRFNAFPWLPTVFQFWDGDEEFMPRLNFLFDANTLSYIHFETAWYVAGHLLDLIDARLD